MNFSKPKGGIFTDSMWLTVVKLMTSLISIVITKVLSTELSLLEYGTYSQGNLIITTATSLSILGLTDGANYFFNRSKSIDEQKKYLNTVFGVQLMAGVLCSVVILGGRNLLTAYFDNSALNPIYVWIMFSPMLANYIAMYQVLFISVGKSKLIAGRNFIFSVAKLLIVIAAVYYFDSVVVIFALLCMTDVIQVLFFSLFWRNNKFLINPFRIDRYRLKAVLGYCIPLAVYIVTSALTRDMDKMVVSRFASTEEFAVFSNCAKVLPFDMLTTSIATVMIPVVTRYIVNEQYAEAKHLYKNYLCFAYTTTWMITAGAIYCSSDLMHLLYDEKYISGLGIFIIYIFVDMIRFANVAVLLRAKGKSFSLMMCSVISLLANLFLDILFVRCFGLFGPAVATLIVTFGMNLFLLCRGAKIIQCRLFELIDIRDMAKLVVQLLLCGIPALLVNYGFDKYFPSFRSELRFFIAYFVYGLPILLLNWKKIIRLMQTINRCRG